jgi:hypothetical protein
VEEDTDRGRKCVMRIYVRSVVLTAVAAAVVAGSGWGASSAFGVSQQAVKSQHAVKEKAVVFSTGHVAGVKGPGPGRGVEAGGVHLHGRQSG